MTAKDEERLDFNSQNFDSEKKNRKNSLFFNQPEEHLDLVKLLKEFENFFDLNKKNKFFENMKFFLKKNFTCKFLINLFTSCILIFLKKSEKNSSFIEDNLTGSCRISQVFKDEDFNNILMKNFFQFKNKFPKNNFFVEENFINNFSDKKYLTNKNIKILEEKNNLQSKFNSFILGENDNKENNKISTSIKSNENLKENKFLPSSSNEYKINDKINNCYERKLILSNNLSDINNNSGIQEKNLHKKIFTKKNLKSSNNSIDFLNDIKTNSKIKQEIYQNINQDIINQDVYQDINIIPQKNKTFLSKKRKFSSFETKVNNLDMIQDLDSDIFIHLENIKYQLNKNLDINKINNKYNNNVISYSDFKDNNEKNNFSDIIFSNSRKIKKHIKNISGEKINNFKFTNHKQNFTIEKRPHENYSNFINKSNIFLQYTNKINNYFNKEKNSFLEFSQPKKIDLNESLDFHDLPLVENFQNLLEKKISKSEELEFFKSLKDLFLTSGDKDNLVDNLGRYLLTDEGSKFLNIFHKKKDNIKDYIGKIFY